MAQEHRSTSRVLDILELLAFGKAEGYTLTEIATELQAPKSSISPIIHTMEADRYLKYDYLTARYNIGRRTFEVGNTYIKKDSFYSQALSIMQNIVNQCLETCHIGELQGSDVQYLMKVDSPEPISLVSAPGRRIPANCTALGKALLCEYSLEELQKLFGDSPTRMTEHSITDINELYRQTSEVQESYIAREKEENYRFVQCIATPIYKNGKPIAALSVSLPTFRYTAEKDAQIVQLLLDAKMSLELIV